MRRINKKFTNICQTETRKLQQNTLQNILHNNISLPDVFGQCINFSENKRILPQYIGTVSRIE